MNEPDTEVGVLRREVNEVCGGWIRPAHSRMGGPSKRSKRKEEKGREDSMILAIEGEIGKKS